MSQILMNLKPYGLVTWVKPKMMDSLEGTPNYPAVSLEMHSASTEREIIWKYPGFAEGTNPRT